MDVVVCCKPVPTSTKAAPDGVRVDRLASELVLGLADKAALELAVRLDEGTLGPGGQGTSGEGANSPGKGAVSALLMGPPEAEGAAREALAFGASRAWLVSDKALAGSDALATARTLAAAAKRIAAGTGDLLPHLILAGAESPDAGTGQVGPSLAGILGLSFLPRVTSLEAARPGRIRARLSDGSLVEAETPVVATVARGACEPRSISLMSIVKSRSRPVVTLTLDDLGLDRSEVGDLGSPTKVEGLEPRPAGKRAFVITGDLASQASQVAALLAGTGAAVAEGGRGTAQPPGGRGATPGLPVLAPELTARTHVWSPVRTEPGLPDLAYAAQAELLVEAVEAGRRPGARPGSIGPTAPEVILFPDSPPATAVAAFAAARLGTGLISHCVALRLGASGPEALVPAFGALARVTCPEARPILIVASEALCLAAGARRFPPPPPGGVGSVSPDGSALPLPDRVAPASPLAGLSQGVRELAAQAPSILAPPAPPPPGQDLATAGVVVAGGAGAARPEIWSLVERLAILLGGMVGATRPVVDSGLAAESQMIGQSGVRVAPRVYLALGISGDLQHTVGLEGARLVVAVNRDPAAPIFTRADYAVVADLEAFLPALIGELTHRRE